MSGLARATSRLIFGHEGLSKRLERLGWVHALARHLRVREWMNSALALRPIRRTLPSSGVCYCVETFETLAVERTYFGNPDLLALFSTEQPETFIDLGCNSGIFPCFLAHAVNGRKPRGLCIDANEQQIALARKNAALNHWTDIHFACGLVGSKEVGAKGADFFLAPTSLGSSQFAHQETESGYPLNWKRTVVPTLEVGPIWSQFFGNDLRCDVLKIDIEGSEMLFLQSEQVFLERVDAILLEWHAFATSRDEVVGFLTARAFALVKILEDEPRHGLLYFRRDQRTPRSGE